MLSSTVWLSTCRRLKKLSPLEEGKTSTVSVFSGLYLAPTVSLLRHQTSRAASRAYIRESDPCVTLHLPSLANTFLGHSGTGHEKAVCGSVLKMLGAILWSPHQGHLAPQKGSRRGVGGHPLLQKSPRGSKASSVIRKKTAIRWIIKKLPGRTVLGLPESKI